MLYIGKVYVTDVSDVVGALILDGVPGEQIDIRDAYYGNAVEIWVIDWEQDGVRDQGDIPF
jgi:hypothetical protein